MVATLEIFKPPRDLGKAGTILADHMPEGRAFGKKCEDGSVMSGLIKGLASDFLIVQEQIFELASQFDISLSVDLLPDWEESVGIPDDCIFNIDTLSERRNAVISRLRNIPVVTKEDFEQLAFGLSGLTVTVTAGRDTEAVFPFSFHVVLGDAGARFHMYVDFGAVSDGFPYTFDFPFSNSARFDVVKCVFARVKPANVIIFYT